MMLRCKDVARRIASGEADRAGWLGRMQLWLHLRMCEHCRRYAAQVRTMGRMAREALSPGPEDAEALRRLEQAVGPLPGRPHADS